MKIEDPRFIGQAIKGIEYVEGVIVAIELENGEQIEIDVAFDSLSCSQFEDAWDAERKRRIRRAYEESFGPSPIKSETP